MGTYLTEKGLGEFVYVLGERGSDGDGDWGSHAWLTQKGSIIDITKSQFPDQLTDITVTQNSEWYDSFEITQTFTANLKGTGDELEPYYRTILEFVNRT